MKWHFSINLTHFALKGYFEYSVWVLFSEKNTLITRVDCNGRDKTTWIYRYQCWLSSQTRPFVTALTPPLFPNTCIMLRVVQGTSILLLTSIIISYSRLEGTSIIATWVSVLLSSRLLLELKLFFTSPRDKDNFSCIVKWHLPKSSLLRVKCAMDWASEFNFEFLLWPVTSVVGTKPTPFHYIYAAWYW